MLNSTCIKSERFLLEMRAPDARKAPRPRGDALGGRDAVAPASMLRPQRAKSDGPGLRAGRAVPEVRRASSLPDRLAADIQALDDTMRRILSLHHQTPRPSYNLSLPPALAREGWTIEWSRRRARWYYFNKQTNASTWEQPVVPKKTVRRFAARPGAPPPSSSRDRAQEAELAFQFQYPEEWFREGVRPRGAPPAAAEQSAPAPPANPGQIWPRMEMVPGPCGMELQQQCALCLAPLDGRVCARCGQRYALSPPRPAADDVTAVDAFGLAVDGAGEAVEQWDQLRGDQVDDGGHEDCVDYEAARSAESRARDPHAERQREIDIYNTETATNADSERRAAAASADYADYLAGRPSSAQQTGHLVRAATAARRPGLGGGDGRAWRGRSGTGLADPSLRDPEPRVLRVSNVPQRRDRGGGGDDDDEEDGGGGDEDLRALCSRYGWIEALEPRVWSTDPVGTVWVLTMGERAAADALLAAAGRGELVLQGQVLEVQREEAPECVVFGGDRDGDLVRVRVRVRVRV